MDRFNCHLEVKFADDGAPAGTFSGYGAIFGNVDSYGDVLQKGAFKDTLREAKNTGRMPKMLLQHGMGFGALDAIPCGAWSMMEEDDVGLKVEGSLFAMNTERGQYIYEGLKSGAIDGLSIGYRPKEFTFGTKPHEPRRLLKKVDLHEVSIVTFPANDKARTSGVKSAAEITTIREFEAALRQIGFSNTQAKSIASHGFKSLESQDEELEQLAKMFKMEADKYRA